MAELINEPVKVGVVFGDNGGIKPKWFIRNRNRVDISKINYRWKTKEGRKTIYRFAVSDGVNVFELSYNQEDSKWELTAIDVS